MSRRSITSVGALQALLNAHQSQAAVTGARHLVTLLIQADAVPPEFNPRGTVAGNQVSHRLDASDRITTWLGTDRAALFWSSNPGWRIAELAAAIGSLHAGGMAVVCITPQALAESALLTRFLDGVETYPKTPPAAEPFHEVWRPEVSCYDLYCTVDPSDITGQRPDAPSGNLKDKRSIIPSMDEHRGPAIAAQRALLRKAVGFLSRDEPRDRGLVIITGARGTGKSALLGYLHSHLCAHSTPPVVTAPRRSAIQTLKRFGSAVTFMPADRALDAAPGPLIVDEAASLPAAQLRRLAAHHGPVILATTIEGYEPGGRAFALRTVEDLTDLHPDCLHLNASMPMRWRDDDAIDPLLREALLLPAEHEQVSAPPRIDVTVSSICIERLTPEDFRRNPGIAKTLVTLLNNNHYQSTLAATDDLLTGRVSSYAARHDEQWIGIATAVEEKAIPADLHSEIMANRRRLPDRLLPQLLARCSNRASALSCDFTRIIRIAVVDSARRQGIGRQLVESINEHSTGAKALGAVFALDGDTGAFWNSLGFTCFHEGQRANPRSGRTSAAVLRTQDAGMEDTLELAASILGDNKQPSRHSPDPDRDQALLLCLAAGARGVAETRGPLYRLWWSVSSEPHPFKAGSASCPTLHSTMTARQRDRAIVTWARTQLGRHR